MTWEQWLQAFRDLFELATSFSFFLFGFFLGASLLEAFDLLTDKTCDHGGL